MYKNRRLCCPHCGAKFLDIGLGVESLASQRLTPQGEYEDTEIGTTEGYYCLECGKTLPEEIGAEAQFMLESNI